MRTAIVFETISSSFQIRSWTYSRESTRPWLRISARIVTRNSGNANGLGARISSMVGLRIDNFPVSRFIGTNPPESARFTERFEVPLDGFVSHAQRERHLQCCR